MRQRITSLTGTSPPAARRRCGRTPRSSSRGLPGKLFEEPEIRAGQFREIFAAATFAKYAEVRHLGADARNGGAVPNGLELGCLSENPRSRSFPIIAASLRSPPLPARLPGSSWQSTPPVGRAGLNGLFHLRGCISRNYKRTSRHPPTPTWPRRAGSLPCWSGSCSRKTLSSPPFSSGPPIPGPARRCR